jgi:DNA-cytosine methyltransferase
MQYQYKLENNLGINVLSLFDGMSGAQIALERAGIPILNYFASEIDKFAMKITQKNYPRTIHKGDVDSINKNALPKIDLLIGGSPCQGFSVSGKRLNFDDPRSKLFFSYVKILEEVNPTFFLLENVKMKKEYQDIISKYIGVESVEINSNLVSAQNRKRLYWTNIPFSMPEDKHIYFKDIIEKGFVDKNKSLCLDASYFKGGSLKTLIHNYVDKSRRQIVFDEPVIIQKPRGKNKFGLRALNGKVPALSSSSWQTNNFIVYPEDSKWRMLTPVECERLQTVSDNYTEGVSKTQRYKMLGNGFTVDIIAHILKGMKGVPL